MILFILVALGGLGCLATLLSLVRSLIDHTQRSDPITSCLTPVLVSSHNGESVVVPFVLLQVYCLQMSSSVPSQIQHEGEHA